MSSDDWPEVRLGDLVDVKHGFAFEGQFFRDEPTSDVLLTPGNFAIGGGFKDDKLKYYDGPVPEEFLLSAGELLLSMTDLSKETGTLGYPALVPESSGLRYLHNQRLGRVLIRDRALLDRGFLYYILCTPAYRHEVLAGATGTTVKHTSPSRIAGFRLRLPPMPTQIRIASTLSALDHKSGLNRRTNRTLESIARVIFKSWFVDFDPVGKKMEGGAVRLPPDLAARLPSARVQGGNGELPASWPVRTLGDIAVQVRLQVRPEELEAGTPYFGLEHLPRRSIALGDWGVADKVASGKSRFAKGDYLFGKLRPYFHKVGPAPVDGVCSTDIVVIRPRHPDLGAFVLGHLSSDDFVDHAAAGSSGTRMPRTSWKDMAAYPLVMPPDQALRAYQATVNPLLQRIQSSILESRTLVEARDQLLPQLLAGRLSAEGT
jgi:type I restriction enzyme, S subunit